MIFDVVLLAGGSGLRMGKDKLMLGIGEDIVLARTAEAFVRHTDVDKIILVLRKDIFDVGRAVAQRFGADKFRFVEGGDSRTQSVENGLREVKAEGVLIHDGARPFVSPSLIDAVTMSVRKYGSGIPAIPVPDSLRYVTGEVISGTAERSGLFAVQTPQGFVTKTILDAYLQRQGKEYTDDSAVYAQFVATPHVVNGDERNTKITTLGTYFGLNSKIGIGYDLHRLAPFRKLVLGGIEIPCDKGTVAHSDGDAAIHALIDALLSAIGEGDIGTRFPDTDPRLRDIDSAILLSDTMELYRAHNYKISNISLTIIIDKPKLADYIPLMKIKLANLTGIPASLIGIAAKTTESTKEDIVETYCAVIIT